MTYGLTGNPTKPQMWPPLARLVTWLQEEGFAFCIHEPVADGLRERGYLDGSVCDEMGAGDLAMRCDIVLSFGGDGTLLRTAHEIGPNDTPVLGVNIGRLGFLADIEVDDLFRAIRTIEDGRYSIEERMVLEATVDGNDHLDVEWALNEFVLDRSGEAGLIEIEVNVDGEELNTYWADGLIMSTPTGSTAYSLSTGGPILAPGVEGVILTPIAPHTLTVRPIVLPSSVTIQARVLANDQPYVFAADGRSTLLEEHDLRFTVARAQHTVNLVKLEDQHFFKTLRKKLMWGLSRSTKDAVASSASAVPSAPKIESAPNVEGAAS